MNLNCHISKSRLFCKATSCSMDILEEYHFNDIMQGSVFQWKNVRLGSERPRFDSWLGPIFFARTVFELEHEIEIDF